MPAAPNGRQIVFAVDNGAMVNDVRLQKVTVGVCNMFCDAFIHRGVCERDAVP